MTWWDDNNIRQHSCHLGVQPVKQLTTCQILYADVNIWAFVWEVWRYLTDALQPFASACQQCTGVRPVSCPWTGADPGTGSQASACQEPCHPVRQEQQEKITSEGDVVPRRCDTNRLFPNVNAEEKTCWMPVLPSSAFGVYLLPGLSNSVVQYLVSPLYD